MFLRTDGGLRAVRMGRRQLLTHRTPYLVTVVSQIHVVFLVDGFQLGMETANHHVLETVGLNLRPVLNLVRRDVLYVARHIVRREGIRTLGTDSCHQLVVLVGNEVLCCHLTHRVNLVIGLLTGLSIGQFTICLVTLLNIRQQRSLCRGVRGAKLLGTLEHQVLQIVSQTGCLGRVVLRTCPHGDIGLNAGLFLVHTQIHLQSVVQRIDARLALISLQRLILVVLCLRSQSCQQANCQ